jgi:16S rRNA (uracil1498-N3)-methyltransferase
MKSGNAHEFALFVGNSKIIVDDYAKKITLHDSDIINRIITVLRLKIGKNIILFDRTHAYSCTLSEINKKNIICAILSSSAITSQSPELHILLPVLEREALEDTVYMATVYGATAIQLIATEKSRHSLTEKDYLRLEKIAISAAEQSKQFFLPKINPIISLESFLHDKISAYNNYTKLWCDISGENILKQLAGKKSDNNYLVTLGPEGDFTPEEKIFLKKYFTPVKLTNSILRAKDAASLLLGIIRSC